MKKAPLNKLESTWHSFWSGLAFFELVLLLSHCGTGWPVHYIQTKTLLAIMMISRIWSLVCNTNWWGKMISFWTFVVQVFPFPLKNCCTQIKMLIFLVNTEYNYQLACILRTNSLTLYGNRVFFFFSYFYIEELLFRELTFRRQSWFEWSQVTTRRFDFISCWIIAPRRLRITVKFASNDSMHQSNQSWYYLIQVNLWNSND